MSEAHWADLLVFDHETIERVFAAVERAFEDPAGPNPELIRGFLTFANEYVDGCHNKKEENHLFVMAESRGLPSHGGPLAVMLHEHRQSELLLAEVTRAGEAFLSQGRRHRAALLEAFSQYAGLLKNHFWKETDILYPMARRLLSEADDAIVLRGIADTEAALGPDTRQRYYALAERLVELGQVKDLSTTLDPTVLAAILNRLPVELSFVDADDTVRYFSHENQHKIFPRTRGAIGTNVKDCHPEKSLPMVQKIIADFKAGARDVAEFWLDFQGMKVHVRYFPVRGAAGEYLGTLEVVQDVTAIQKLAGERRLLDER